MMLTARAAVVQGTFSGAQRRRDCADVPTMRRTPSRSLWHLRRDGQSTTQRHLSALGSKIWRSPDLTSGAQWAAGFWKPGFHGRPSLEG